MCVLSYIFAACLFRVELAVKFFSDRFYKREILVQCVLDIQVAFVQFSFPNAQNRLKPAGIGPGEFRDPLDGLMLSVRGRFAQCQQGVAKKGGER